MLRRGHHPEHIAEATRVPLALVQLIAEDLDPRSPTRCRHASPPTPATRPTCGPTRSPIPPDEGVAPRCARAVGWAAARVGLGVVLGLLVDGGLAAAAVITHLRVLGAVVWWFCSARCCWSCCW